ncbi:ATP-binding cassette domain-containing protein [Clostridium sp. LY3-2]|uniref:ABC transporter ATP-binding protein n=1 Tax=Clostridium sp. LY3-2 TaxID=2942482 RepID=UPI0021539BC0|nr:ATP-binding cassette domain-containing protein [Clostridium sp. LY3-2]MCR6514252.1 ATP-binding cassette domain-containing protein [Clostridium sp. LY3-2]
MRIEVKNISKSFKDVKALNNLSFAVEEGEALGLLGRNGAGKTTTIRILLDIIESDSGEVLFDGSEKVLNQADFGYLPEERGLYLKYTVKNQLLYFLSLRGVSKSEGLKTIDFWLEKFEIKDYLNKKVETLSKGNKQKIQLIVALMHDPSVIILDEPFSGLDPVNVELFKNVIRELLEKGKTLIFSSHRMADVEEFCDEIVMLKDGESILQGNLEKIKEEYGMKDLVIETSFDIKEILDNKELSYVEQKNRYVVDLKDLEKGRNLLKEMIEKGIEIDSFYFEKPSLNDIFIERLGD